MAQWGDLKRETKSLLKVIQNNVMRTNHVKSKIDNRRIASVSYVVTEKKKSIT